MEKITHLFMCITDLEEALDGLKDVDEQNK
jgi:hypothetical protein